MVGRQQRTDGQQRYPQGQIEPATGVILDLDRVDVQHEHIQQPDRQTHAHPAQQEAHEHQPGPPVPGQHQVNDEQLRVQRREAGQPEERRGHLCLAGGGVMSLAGAHGVGHRSHAGDNCHQSRALPTLSSTATPSRPCHPHPTLTKG